MLICRRCSFAVFPNTTITNFKLQHNKTHTKHLQTKTVASVKPTPALPKMISLKKIRDTDDLSSPVPDVGVKSLAGTVLFCHGKLCYFCLG